MRITDAARRLAFATAVALVVLAAPAWATPAGSNGRIFEKELTSDTTCHVVSRAPDGTDPTQALASCPDFSFDRDGKVTAETAHEGTHGVDIIKNGQVVRTITVASRTSSQSYALAVLSPDGARVAFTLDESDAFNKTYSSLYVAPTDGSAGPRLLYGYNAMAGTGGVVRDWPAWTPDSHAIATFFYPTTSDASAFGNPHLATFDPATGTMTDRGASSALAPSDSTAWMVPFAVEDASPDGTRLLLFAERQDFNSTTSSTDTIDRLWEVNLADNTRVSNSEYSTVNRLVIGAAYSPDGTQLAIHDLNYDGTSPNQGDNLIIKQLHGTAQSVVPIRAGATTAQGTDVVWLAGAPDVVITQGPLGTVRSHDPTFEFTTVGSTPGHFECRLDSSSEGDFATCDSPKAYSGLADGPHHLDVRFVPTGADPGPATTRTWTIDSRAPAAVIDTAPSGAGNAANATITFHADDSGASFQCSLDGATFTDCSSPHDEAGLSAGTHTFAVRAIDAAGNVQADPATASWTVGSPGSDSNPGSPPPTDTAPSSSYLPPAFTACLNGSTGRVAFGKIVAISRASDGCFNPVGVSGGEPVWASTGVVSVNGILVTPDPGSRVRLSSKLSGGLVETQGPVTLRVGSISWKIDRSISWSDLVAAGVHQVLPFTGDEISKQSGLSVGDLPLAVSPDFELSTSNDGQAKVSLKLSMPTAFRSLPGVGSDKGAAGGLTLDFSFTASNAKGVAYALKAKIKEAFAFGQKLKDLSLAYDSAKDQFEGTGTLSLGQGKGDLTVTVVLGPGGFFDRIRKIAIEGSNLNRYVGYGIFVQRFGGEIVREQDAQGNSFPELSVNAGVSLGPHITIPSPVGGEPLFDDEAIGLDGTDKLTLGSPWTFGFTGQGKVLDIPIADATVLYTSGAERINIDGKLDEQIAGYGFIAQLKDSWADFKNEDFNLEATGKINVPGLNQDGDVVVSKVGYAACFGVFGQRVGFAQRWGKPLEKFGLTCDVGPFRVTQASAARAGARTVHIAPGTSLKALSAQGAGAPPKLVLTGPGGQRIATPTGPDGLQTRDAVIFQDPGTNTTDVALLHPKPGDWTVDTAVDSVPIVGFEQADGLPAPRVKARVSGRGSRRTLAWHMRSLPGQRVTFSEQGPKTAHVLTTTTRARGHVSFTPDARTGGARTIEALVVQGGLPRARLTVAHFSAPRPPRLRRVTGISLHGRTLTWHGEAAAASYAASVLMPDGSRLAKTSKRTRVTIPRVRGRITVTVVALDSTGRVGPRSTAHVGPRPRRGRHG